MQRMYGRPGCRGCGGHGYLQEDLFACFNYKKCVILLVPCTVCNKGADAIVEQEIDLSYLDQRLAARAAS